MFIGVNAAGDSNIWSTGDEVSSTKGEVTSRNLWSHYDRHFVGKT